VERNAQHLRCCSLLLQRLAQLVEQAGVLDGDDSLLGKIAHQLDLLLCEGSHLLAVNSDCTDDLVILQHRDGKETARSGGFDKADHSRITVDIRLLRRDVGNVDNLFGSGDPAERRVRIITHHRFPLQPRSMGS
jgi:hypothetical protein